MMTLAWLMGGLVGTLGLTGAIALLIGGPPLAVLILQGVWKLIVMVVLAVLKTRTGCAIVAAIVFGLIGNYHGDSVGRGEAQAECREAEVRAALEVAQRDLAAVHISAAADKSASKAIEERADERETKVVELERELAKRAAGDRCRLDAPRAQRLRGLSPD